MIKSLNTVLHSKNVDLDALKRLLFQGGREQNEQPVPQEKAERLQSKKQKSKTAKPEKDRVIRQN